MIHNDTVIALASPAGVGAIAILRISGPKAIEITAKLFQPIGKKSLADQASHTIHLGHIVDKERVIDQVLVSIFKNPNSYTGQDVIEINCHGSVYIQQEIIQLFLKNGCRSADPGEFTLRAFLNGKMDLSQAEAVADLINSNSKAAHQIAIQQMRGGITNELKELRQQLLDFASLIELELDFSGEDVEFADRSKFKELLDQIIQVLKRLIESFALGNAMKNGIPVAILGAPNAGKSTLLNTLVNEERAIVSDIAGTTRDAIEDEVVLDGIVFRFIDTAGIRNTNDQIEAIGIQKAYEKAEKAQVIIFLIDAQQFNLKQAELLAELDQISQRFHEKRLLIVANKVDLLDAEELKQLKSLPAETLQLSAKTDLNVTALKSSLLSLVNSGALSTNEVLVTNSRHFEALNLALESILAVQTGLENELPSDLMAIDLRECLGHLGTITGEYDVDQDILGNIFSNFCIGK